MALGIKPGAVAHLQNKVELGAAVSKEFVQAVKVKLDKDTCLVGAYVAPKTSGNKAEEPLENIHGMGNERKIKVRDLNART